MGREYDQDPSSGRPFREALSQQFSIDTGSGSLASRLVNIFQDHAGHKANRHHHLSYRQLVEEAAQIISQRVQNQHPTLEVNQQQDMTLMFLQPGPSGQSMGGFAGDGYPNQGFPSPKPPWDQPQAPVDCQSGVFPQGGGFGQPPGEVRMESYAGQQELQIVSNTLNATVIALAVIAVGERLLDESTFLWWQQWDIIQPVRHVTQALWHAYDGGIEKYPILAKAVISGLVYSLGDITAQSYEGRSVSEFDGARIARSGACGFLGHGPLSHFYYNALDRYFIVTPIFTDKWFTPIIKLFIDQTAWAVTWNSLYYCLLGALKGEGPDTILATIKQSWFPLVKAGWRIWPFAHAITYNYIPTEHKLLWVNMVELSWVSILSFYGQQQRERAIAAAMQDAALPPAQVACALPNAGSTGGGSVSEELLRSMETERNIIFEGSDGRISRPAAEVYVEAAIAEAAMKQLSAQQAANMPPIPTGQSSDGSSHYSNGAAGGNGSSSSSSSSNGSSPSSNGAHSSSGADTRERVK
ncbi:hypothetical protein WJX84_001347 [Apatococcus fuscideae]|uniref:Uncharacterized protein n=1 Tax=Apatococcus fuscideae TaxID=2026836 RepID=A0AAW1SVZ6_9CHLO